MAAMTFPPLPRCVAALLVAAPLAAAATPWPLPALPDNATPFDVGGEMNMGGLPMRIRGFVSPAPREDVAAWFRRSMGAPVVENQLGAQLVLGQARGDYYVTVQLDQTPTGTRGMVAVTNLKSAAERRETTLDATRRMLDRLPSGTRVVRDMASRDGRQLSHYVVLNNAVGEAVNRERITRYLQEDGLRLERARKNTLWFKGPGKEATVVLGRDPQGASVVVFNTVTLMEQLQ